jgi:hypothetical protein
MLNDIIFKCIIENNNFFVIYFLKQHDTIQSFNHLTDENGNTITIYLLKYGSSTMISFFLEKFSDVDCNLYDDENVHVLFYIIQNMYLHSHYVRRLISSCVSQINSYNEKFGSLIYHAVYHNNLDAVKLLIEMNADTNNIDINGDPVAFYSVINGLIEFTDIILRSENFNVNKTNISNESLLEVSVIKNTIFAVEHSILILDKRPNVLKDKQCTLNLMSILIEKRNTRIAFKLYQHYSASVIQRLIKRNREIKSKT